MIERREVELAAALYLPLTTALIGRLLHGLKPRHFAACLLSLLWVVPALSAVEKLNAMEHWWSFPGRLLLYDMPLELFSGWAILWGLVPPLLFPGLGIAVTATILVAFDCLVMPLGAATIRLAPSWLFGEAAAVALVLLPALCLSRWTRQQTHLAQRATSQLIIALSFLMFLVSEVSGRNWTSLILQPAWALQLWVQGLFLLALPGLGAVMEFVQRGEGTPLPYDPPRCLVTSGIYRYVANPMQASFTASMLLLAVALRSSWMLAGALVAIAYSAGIAEWQEREDLSLRFGDPWRQYRRSVRNWLPRWRPYDAGAPARLYLARSCEVCSELRRWIEARKPSGLEIADAEELLRDTPIERMRYEHGDGTASEDGIRAMGRALEHLHLGWALAGCFLRLPVCWYLIQLIMDASGFGPRQIPAPPPSR